MSRLWQPSAVHRPAERTAAAGLAAAVPFSRLRRRVGDELTTGQENTPLVHSRVKYDWVVDRLSRRHPAFRKPVPDRVVVVALRRESALSRWQRRARSIAVDARTAVTNRLPRYRTRHILAR